MRAVLSRVAERYRNIRHGSHKWLHHGHNYAHLAYVGGVFVEGHGFYASMGGVLFILGVVAIVVGANDANEE